MDLHCRVLHHYVQPHHINSNCHLSATFHPDIPGFFPARPGPFLEQNGHFQRVASDGLHANNYPVHRVAVARRAIRDGMVLDRHPAPNRPHQPPSHLLPEFLQFVSLAQKVLAPSQTQDRCYLQGLPRPQGLGPEHWVCRDERQLGQSGQSVRLEAAGGARGEPE